MEFKDVLTVEGERMLAMAAAGTTVSFTKLIMGSGYLAAGVNEKNVTSVVKAEKELSIQAVTLNNSNTICVQSYFSNEEVSGFYFREKAIYMSDGTEEVLAIYGNTGSSAEYIEDSSVMVLERKLRTVLMVTSDEFDNITLSNATNAIAPVILDTFTLDTFVSTATAQSLEIGQVVILSKKAYTYVGDDCTNTDCYTAGGAVLSDAYKTKIENGDAAGGIGASQHALANAYKDLDDSKAKKSHASNTAEYGSGTDTEYGHVKLSDSVTSSMSTADGTAATPNAVKITYDLASKAKEIADYAIAREDSTTTISADGLTITTTHADGTQTVTTIDNAGTSIIEEEMDADLNIVAKYGTYIEGNTITEKELSIG